MRKQKDVSWQFAQTWADLRLIFFLPSFLHFIKCSILSNAKRERGPYIDEWWETLLAQHAYRRKRRKKKPRNPVLVQLPAIRGYGRPTGAANWILDISVLERDGPESQCWFSWIPGFCPVFFPLYLLLWVLEFPILTQQFRASVVARETSKQLIEQAYTTALSFSLKLCTSHTHKYKFNSVI